jgi:S-adenosylmethionine hydrolase
VHLAVVDPGVGTSRRGLAIAARGFVFVGPDNGLFTPFLEGGEWEAFELAAPEFRRAAESRTFHGRDVFAPAAAHIALGLSPSRLGPAVSDPARLPSPGLPGRGDQVEGAVVHVDRFGNLVTTIRAGAVAALGARVRAQVGERALPVVGTYADLDVGEAGALVGSHGRLEIAVREGSAHALLRAGRGTPVRLTSDRGGMGSGR